MQGPYSSIAFPRTIGAVGTVFPTVVAVVSYSVGAVHLRSWAAGRLGDCRLWSPLNGGERR